VDVINRLIDTGVDVNHQLTRKRPYTNGRARFTDYDMRDGVAPLFLAALGNDHEAVDILLNAGAEVDLPNVFKMTPLMIAAGMRASGRNTLCGSGGDPARTGRVMDRLLDAGANINVQVTGSNNRSGTLMAYVAGCDQEGRTALMNAAWNGGDAMTEALLERGADPTLRDAKGMSALDLARLPPPDVEGMQAADKERLMKGRAAAAELLEAALARTGGA
jgi:ankyrin repeat protein